jgi:hypothetical protein
VTGEGGQGAIIVGLSLGMLVLGAMLFGELGILSAVMVWPVPLVGAAAFGLAVRQGASRWWLAAIPLLLLTLMPFVLLCSACKFGGDCV